LYCGAKDAERNWLALEPMHVIANLIISPRTASKRHIFSFVFTVFSPQEETGWDR
jgi:hypothetical protein